MKTPKTKDDVLPKSRNMQHLTVSKKDKSNNQRSKSHQPTDMSDEKDHIVVKDEERKRQESFDTFNASQYQFRKKEYNFK